MSIDAYDDSDEIHAYNVALFDVSIKSKPELIEVSWHGNCYDSGKCFFESEIERTRKLVNQKIIEPESTRIVLRNWDGSEEKVASI